ncbi:MAG: GFA family protein [Arenicellales bacterium]
MSDGNSYQGKCFCGSVKLSFSGMPEMMAYCHCDSCRHWAASPVSAFTLWKPDSVQITSGSESIGTYSKTPQSHRKWCTQCGGHLFTEHPEMGLTDVPAAMINGLSFKPAIHVNYQEAVLPLKDGLPKFKDLPKQAGGSGEELSE